ncbi:hypothetical protein QCM80_13610 [Bradyrhizobium sp. SSUT112]|uniref:hypothetical protein n=1 Tax=Bradyrhizobium sp. SSUT112 TaxID=3040604 RepID=UPI00244A425D|nr:hypothetical protein [Bradyrhizobium sp. SSUT112]MDH2351694.1 hypothetical protein [Bradyrhizobium sp. SSUT112]
MKLGGTFGCPYECPDGRDVEARRLNVDGRSGFGHEQAEWHKRTDGDVFVVDEILPGERQVLHDRVPFGDILDIQQKHGSAPIGSRIPFTNLSIESLSEIMMFFDRAFAA